MHAWRSEPHYFRSDVQKTVVPRCPKGHSRSCCPNSLAEPDTVACLGRTRPSTGQPRWKPLSPFLPRDPPKKFRQMPPKNGPNTSKPRGKTKTGMSRCVHSSRLIARGVRAWTHTCGPDPWITHLQQCTSGVTWRTGCLGRPLSRPWVVHRTAGGPAAARACACHLNTPQHTSRWVALTVITTIAALENMCPPRRMRDDLQTIRDKVTELEIKVDHVSRERGRIWTTWIMKGKELCPIGPTQPLPTVDTQQGSCF